MEFKAFETIYNSKLEILKDVADLKMLYQIDTLGQYLYHDEYITIMFDTYYGLGAYLYLNKYITNHVQYLIDKEYSVDKNNSNIVESSYNTIIVHGKKHYFNTIKDLWQYLETQRCDSSYKEPTIEEIYNYYQLDLELSISDE